MEMLRVLSPKASSEHVLALSLLYFSPVSACFLPVYYVHIHTCEIKEGRKNKLPGFQAVSYLFCVVFNAESANNSNPIQEECLP